MTSSLAIRADALSKRYGGTTAVDGLDLAVPAGSVYGFLGPNGAGKTTTVRMLATLLRPTSGTATVAGAPIDDRDAVRERIGYLPETPPLHEELTAREQLAYAAGLRDLPADDAARRADAFLDRFDLADAADRRIGTYSKGMRRKAGIAQALLHDPAVALLDEPTAGLDPRAARTVRETVAGLAGETTVLLSTHALPVVDELADAVGVLSDGRLVAEGSPERLKRRAAAGDEPTLEDAFLEATGAEPDPGAD
ncbi:ABC transporter ATP-binding protein [Halobacteriales archaeon QS_5_70_17]|jgi:ABC-2 type transport system ATP-binding protein|nr:MAG: ABC transporter ATP-binding protein [Halobacteriales archaeon QS_5_70_17]